MALRTRISRLSSSEDDSPSLVTQKPPWKKATKHSTPEEMTMGRSPRPPGGAASLLGSPLLARSSQGLVSQLPEVSPIATVRRRRLSTVCGSEGSSGTSEPGSAAGEDPPVSASLDQQQPPPPPPSPLPPPPALHRPKSWQQNPGLPGIPDTGRRKRQDWKGRAAAMRRLRQWEAHLLQEIEAAVQHELTIQAEGAPSTELTTPAEGAPSTELTIQAEGAPSTELTTQAEGAPSTELTIQAEGAPSTELTIQAEGAPSTELTTQAEGAPSTELTIQAGGMPSTRRVTVDAGAQEPGAASA